MVREAEGAIPPLDTTTEEKRALAKVHEIHAQTHVATSAVEAQRHVKLGLAFLGSAADPEAQNLRAWLWMEAGSPFGIDAEAVRTLERLAETPGLKPPVLVWIGIRAAEQMARRGDLRRAAVRLESAATVTTLDANGGRVIFHARSRVARLAGRFDEAAHLHDEAIALFGPSPAPSSEEDRARLARLRGDIEDARDILRPLREAPDAPASVERLWLDLELDLGRVKVALQGLETALDRAAAAKHDKTLYDTARAYVEALTRAHEAEALGPTDLATADGLLAVAKSAAVAIARDEVPWYRVLFGGLAADLRMLPDAGLRGDAATMLEVEWRKAVAEWPEAAPPLSRALVHALMARGRTLDAVRTLDDAIPDAIAQRHLRELARLAAARVALLVRTMEPESTVCAALDEMRLVLDEADAPRLRADTLLELAKLLPDASTQPDPVRLLEEATELYGDMPMPAMQARGLEMLGDLFRARGARRHAAMRYLAAHSLLAKHDLQLRIPLLRRKSGITAA
ncbi:MAG: hypothetical protein U0441_12320 [Polyangiaceae bacterium]